MNRERSILHLNVADFAVAVERVVDRSLCRRPVIVAPLQAARAAVYDMSEEAYNDGVRKGMLLRQAARLCRAAQVLPPRPDLYRRAMNAFVNEARLYTPVLQNGEEDGHLFLDITGTHRLFGAAPDVGWRLRRRVRERLGFDPIWSLAVNKLVAKVASRLVKPVGEYIVGGGEEACFLAPLPILLLPGLSNDEKRQLSQFNIFKIGQLASVGRTQLCSVFGERGDRLHEISHGIDDELVSSAENRAPARYREHVFADDTGEHHVVAGVVGGLAVRLGMLLRADGLAGRRVALTLTHSDGSRVSRQAAVRCGVSDDESLRGLALLALDRAWQRRTRVRSCSLLCDRLHRRSGQLSLFAETTAASRRKEQLAAALDVVRRRFGVDAVRFGRQPIMP